MNKTSKPQTLADLKGSHWDSSNRADGTGRRSVKDEIRRNLIGKLKNHEPIFPGIVGYEDTIVPQIINALLSKHNFILLGLRGQAKTRILRQLVTLLDDEIPVLAESELNDDPFNPISAEGKRIVAEEGDEARISWLPRAARYIEKLATPDVTVADIVGDIDPIKAAKLNTKLGDELSVHYGLLPRANRGIFAMNELPDLSGKVQVALFNVMQEGDVQIKGYPIRIALDVLLVFSANPEDYTARGKIITPLKDRIGSEIRTHYPQQLEQGMAITAQEAWTERDAEIYIPSYVAEIVEEVAFQARDDKRVDKHSGVSQRLPISLMENVVSSAEQRALVLEEPRAIARVADVYAGLSAITGKLELEYEGELKGGESVAKDIVRRAIGQVFSRQGMNLDVSATVDHFEQDNALRVPENLRTEQLPDILTEIPGLLELAKSILKNEQSSNNTSNNNGNQKSSNQKSSSQNRDTLGAAAEFVLEGLYARKQISKSEEYGYSAKLPDMEAQSRRRWN